MNQDAGFDRPWWDIETLLKWIGKDEPAGLAEIEKHIECLGLTGQLGPLYPGFGRLKPREPIPEIEFADCVLQKFNGRFVYLSNPETRGSPLAGWQHLRLRADKARAIWLRGETAPLETNRGMTEGPAAGKGGRKPRSGTIDDEDALRRMLEILAQGEAPSVFAAAGIVTKVGGLEGASVESIRRRLSRKFTERYGTEPPSGRVWSDIEF